MSAEDWLRFEALVRTALPQAPTQARAQGIVISRLIDRAAHSRPDPGPLDWMDWERLKRPCGFASFPEHSEAKRAVVTPALRRQNFFFGY